MSLEIFQHRGGLARTREALKRGDLTVGFLGGSITDARPGHNWPEPVTAWLAERFPEIRLSVENAAIGATGSLSAVFRVDRDILARNCDLVFVEYAVNDHGVDSAERMRTREGLLRKLLADGARDVVLVYTFSQPMYAEMREGRVPPSIAELEQLGERYNIGSVWMALHALREVEAGHMRWEEWLPDGLHPQSRGSLSYGTAVRIFLERELIASPSAGEIARGEALPAPLTADHWQSARVLPFGEMEWSGPWTLRRWPHYEWIEQALCTSAPGSVLRFSFAGRALAMGMDFGTHSADFRIRLDGGEWREIRQDRPDWCGPSGWYKALILADDLASGDHRVELETLHGDRDGCKGTNFRLGFIGTVEV